MSYSLKSHMKFPRCLKDYLDPRHYKRWATHCIQRARYGHSFRDLWNLDYHVAQMLIHALPSYLNSTGKASILYVLVDDDKWDDYYFGRCTDEETRAMMRRWDAMVIEIIEALKAAYDEDTIVTLTHKEELAVIERAERAMLMYAKNFRKFWD